MRHQEVKPSQAFADKHTLLAQKYAGYLIGHNYRNTQWKPEVKVSKAPWREPAVVADKCEFCVTLTNEQAVRRVAGFQYQLDIETTRMKYAYFQVWLMEGVGIPEPESSRSQKNLRKFVELFQDVVTPKRPNGWKLRPLPFYKLPTRLKRKLCIEWNHLYLKWMAEDNLHYDKEKREFYKELPDNPDRPVENDATISSITLE